MDVQTRSQLISHQDIESLLDIKEELNIVNDIIGGHQVVVEDDDRSVRETQRSLCKRPKGHEKYLHGPHKISSRFT